MSWANVHKQTSVAPPGGIRTKEATLNWKLNCWGSKTQPISCWVSPKYRISQAVCTHCPDSSHLQCLMSLPLPTSPLSPLAIVSWMAGWEAPPSALPSQGSAVAQSHQASFLCHGGGRGWLGGLSKLDKKWLSPCVRGRVPQQHCLWPSLQVLER